MKKYETREMTRRQNVYSMLNKNQQLMKNIQQIDIHPILQHFAIQ